MKKHFLPMSILTVCLLLLATSVQARDISNWSISALRGSYTFSGSAWQDLSDINPELPDGYAPVTIIGAFTVEGNGNVTGWALVNAGGISFIAEFVDSNFSDLQADGSFSISLSMRINDFGGIIEGPYSYMGVITNDAPSLEIAFMMIGTGPGSHVELSHAKRISKKIQ